MEYLGKVLEVGERISACCNLDKKMRKLKRKLEDLRGREVNVKSELEYAETLSLKRRKREVENWLESVKERKNEAEIVEGELSKERRFHMRVWLGKRVDEITGEMEELLERGRFNRGLVLDDVEARGNVLLTSKMVGQWFKEHLSSILTLLAKEDSRVGIYGMGGIGKTTLVSHVHNRLLRESSTFGSVYWVTVSRDFSVRKLQNDIARVVPIDLSEEADEKKRASRLALGLMRRERYVLILDDVWESFSLERVGIPAGRLVLTSRSLEVCRKLGCQENIKIEPLSNDEGWELFVERLERRSPFPLGLEGIARRVSSECAGLPLGIIAMAGSLRESDDFSEWRDALERLKHSWNEHGDMEKDVYQVLRASYEAINDPVVQQCFLYCALYPEDYKIERNELIERFIDEGLFNGMRTRQAEFDRGNTILNKLENACLLEGTVEYSLSEKRCVKMHDLVRDLALKIKSSGHVFVVRSGQGLMDFPEEEELWTENFQKASFMRNKISKIDSGVSPNCPRLSTLMLQHNGLKVVPHSFFAKMSELKVLDLSNTGIRALPSSVSELKSLSALSLRDCDKLRFLPSFARLTALKRLDLRNSGITKVPHGLDMLTNLRYLDLQAPKLKEVPNGTISKLSHLQYLVLYGLSKTQKVKGREIASLRKLETFRGQFYGIRGLNTYVKSLNKRGPGNYILQVGLNDPYFAPIDSGNFDKQLIMRNCNISKSKEGEECLVIPTDVQYLYFHQCRDIASLCDIASLEKAKDLKSLVIKDCESVEYAFKSSSFLCYYYESTRVASPCVSS